MLDGYYVDAIRDSRVALLAGPFLAHAEALAVKDRAVALACELDPWAWFDLHGTCRRPATKVGVLNGRLGLPVRLPAAFTSG